MVLLITRVSRPAKGKRKKSQRTGYQDERSNEDQIKFLKRWIRKYYKGPICLRAIKGSGSGERLDRKEVARARRAARGRQFDLILTEDLGRIMRRIDAFKFCELAEDSETRVIAVNDSVDTGKDDWRMTAFFAAMKHELYNADNAKRIRRSQLARFESGGMLPCNIYGYLKPKDAETEDDVRKDPSAEPVYLEWFRILDEGGTYQDVADWLNETGVQVGPYCRSPKWTCRIVGRITHNPILKGVRVRNDRTSKRVNRTGRRRVVKAPEKERAVRNCPHLAFIDEAYYDRVVAAVDERNRHYRRKVVDGQDCRTNVPKKRTRFPGQMAYCGICGRLYVFGGHGQTDHLMCNGAREHFCWCGATIDGPLAAERIADAIASQIAGLEDFDSTFVELLNEEADRINNELDTSIRQVRLDLERNQRETENVVSEIRAGNASQLLRTELERLEQEATELDARREDAERSRVARIVLPSAADLKRLYREAFQGLAKGSYRFARKMRVLVPRIVVFPVQLCDGGHIVLRAKFRLRLAGLIQDRGTRKAVDRILQTVMTVDLFTPPQREAFRTRVVALRRAGRKEREVAKELGITQPAVQKAAALQRKMDELGITDPYVPVTEPPADGSKLSRHKHKRYRFEPLDGAGGL
jgi:hypothetical protein